jgi:hypothetical protein
MTQTVLLAFLAFVMTIGTVAGATAAIKLIGSSTKAGLVALGIMLLGVIFVMLDSFIIVDSHYRDGRSAFIRLAADAPFCECHSTRSGDKVNTTCSPLDCGKNDARTLPPSAPN